MDIKLSDVIAANRPLIVPSVYDGISALAARNLRFPAVYIGSYATGATKYGLPDLGYIGLEDMADQTRRIGGIVDVPIIIDGEGGFGNPLHVARAIRVLERAGASAVHIEDHDFGKHITDKPRVLPLSMALDKIKAAVDAKSDEDFLVIARTDSPGSLGTEEGVDRALAFQEAGADCVFIAGRLTDAAWARVRNEITVPVFSVDIPGQSAAELASLGVDVILHYGVSHFAAQAGITAALQRLAETGNSPDPKSSLPTMGDFDTFLGIEEARVRARTYGLVD